jgi:hypothetical protein
LITAQEAISAHIIDAETLKPIDLVSVVSSVSGTITNREGGFIVRADSNDYVQLSHISYYSQSILVQQLSDTIFLQPKVFELAEFIIMPREAIIRELTVVWNKYNNLLRGKRDRDFPVRTFYYRQLTQNNDIYTEYIEAFFTAPTSINARELFLQEGRFAAVRADSILRVANFFRFSQGVRPLDLEDAKLKNAANPFLVKDFEKYYDVSIIRVISLGNEDEVMAYQFIPYQKMISTNAVMLSGQLYVRTKDRAIVRMEVFTHYVGLRNTSNVANEAYHITVTYQDSIESYPIVESVRAEATITQLRDGQPHRTLINSILYAANHSIETKGRARRLRQRDNLLRIVANSRYNQEFWDNNPFIKRTKVEQQVLDDFNRLEYFGNMNFDE